MAAPSLALAESPDVTDDFNVAAEYGLPLNVSDGYLDGAAGDVRDIYRVWLTQGKEFDIGLSSGTAGTDFDLYLFDSPDESVPYVARSAHSGSDEVIHYRVKTSGWYYVDVKAYDGSYPDYPTESGPGSYTLTAGAHTVAYKLTGFSAPKTAKKNKKIAVSIKLSPTYLRSGKPVTFHARARRNGKWYGKTLSYAPRGVGLSTSTKYAVSFKANRGVWRFWVTFSDVDHKRVKSGYKTVKVK